ncbi:MAG: glutamate--tRNA ligase [Bauldia sp.]|uniref:glutamate--tRNA ligase n=1 Tax=Bauldia sp. TaxID=2575872 RepID=UPI001D3D82C0|nr:glutamate--tRNA ligase [Bauldia sp.]MCB1495693.1 glutamate--tRNA ligase [Bauldia sp.]
MTTPVVTRFAPSPTGYLHIGGARTALFNWLYAKHTGGRMLLRIEDTDRERSTDAAITAILDGMTWLGLDWSGEPVHQFARAGRHREVADDLLARGLAYRCYATAEELNEMRALARAEGRSARYDGRWRDRDPSEAPAGVAPSIRIRAPRDGETVIEDHVQGRVAFPNADLDDFVILRSDGTPTYMLAVVVDDHDMGVTHIIRGDDHLTNAGRQKILYDALGWSLPEMAHIPLIHGSDGAKLSKRHGALGVDAYRAMGYLPEALRNYLVRLGWSHGDDEIMSAEEMVAWFDFDGIGRGAARFDFAKLESINAHYIREMSDAELPAILLAELPHLKGGADFAAKLDDERRRRLEASIPLLKERAKTLVELVERAGFVVAERPLPLDEKAEDLLTADARTVLAALLPKLEACSIWTTEHLEPVVKDFAEGASLKLGKVAQPLRASLTGTTTSPGIFDVLEILGKPESLGRIGDQAR